MTSPDFSKFSESYDRMNAILSLGRHAAWRAAAAEDIPADAAEVLDLACGTGDFSFEIARRLPSARVAGLDLSPAMAAVAEKKRPPSAQGRVAFSVGDAADLSRFADESFDAATCAFGFRNFADRPRALAEVARVLKPGGVLVVLEFFRPPRGLVSAATRLWIKTAARIFARDHVAEYDYLADSIAAMTSMGEFAAIAREAGLEEVRRRKFFPATTCATFARRRHSAVAGMGTALRM